MAKTISEINREFEREYFLMRFAELDECGETSKGMKFFESKSSKKKALREQNKMEKEKINKMITQIKAKAEVKRKLANDSNDCEKTKVEVRFGKNNFKQYAGWIANFFFYAILFTGIIMAVTSGIKPFKPRNVFGYSYYTVLTNSMQSEIPQGSLVVTKKSDPAIIRRGDDITYIKEGGQAVTHRVETIIDDYRGSGTRGFQTKGIENPLPDDEIVLSSEVLGVVQMSIPKAGMVMNYLGENILIELFVLGIAILSITVLRMRQAASSSFRGKAVGLYRYSNLL